MGLALRASVWFADPQLVPSAKTRAPKFQEEHDGSLMDWVFELNFSEAYFLRIMLITCAQGNQQTARNSLCVDCRRMFGFHDDYHESNRCRSNSHTHKTNEQTNQ
eukprot:6480927-Amphidinium_carterae.1